MTCEQRYEERLIEERNNVRIDETRRVLEEWKGFKEAVLKYVGGVCRVREVGCGRKRKGGEWWNEELKSLVKEKNGGVWTISAREGVRVTGRSTRESGGLSRER